MARRAVMRRNWSHSTVHTDMMMIAVRVTNLCTVRIRPTNTKWLRVYNPPEQCDIDTAHLVPASLVLVAKPADAVYSLSLLLVVAGGTSGNETDCCTVPFQFFIIQNLDETPVSVVFKGANYSVGRGVHLKKKGLTIYQKSLLRTPFIETLPSGSKSA